MQATFLRNAWYMLAWSREVLDTPFARTVLDEPVVVYRNSAEAGDLTALMDRCPHRFAPLSRGQLVDGNIECPYHGLQFNSAGKCVHNPFGAAIPAAAKVKSYPVQEVDHAIWIWMGEPALADTAAIPLIDYHHGTGERWVSGLTTARADYRLLSDNLMDLSHTTLIHPGLGGRDYRPKVKSWEQDNGDVVASFITESMNNFFGEQVIPAARVRHCDTIRWSPPSTHYLTSGTGLVGAEQALLSIYSAHILTPETATSTHYFWSSTVPEGFEEDMIRETLIQAFDREDKPMVEAVQVRMGGAELWDLKPVLLPSDVGGVRMRRKLEALIKAEQAAAPTPTC
ncbi:aromatic ring-hydroxylating dioxygenase subunit alpha [Pseudomonas sp. R5(2019)]|uniref:aromatic ring-hydroxylating dioxygenase subunit alpha n=1 Tax=Pseudomonas sp. R5(2019) TaxID=2697566 RepID=UPI0014134A2E|nr:aromatic ring-hydroxylating dioxygenase subunit alpha [Pseudomonas sp. R5(2019)]NBA98153.1 Rieske 2Fe-2S domain-containing protein [Pseudomonas sp. R5(2019)]